MIALRHGLDRRLVRRMEAAVAGFTDIDLRRFSLLHHPLDIITDCLSVCLRQMVAPAQGHGIRLVERRLILGRQLAADTVNIPDHLAVGQLYDPVGVLLFQTVDMFLILRSTVPGHPVRISHIGVPGKTDGVKTTGNGLPDQLLRCVLTVGIGSMHM